MARGRLSRRTEFRECLGELLLASEVCCAGLAYCVTLASFGTPRDADLLAAYLDRYLRRPDLAYDQTVAMGFLASHDRPRPVLLDVLTMGHIATELRKRRQRPLEHQRIRIEMKLKRKITSVGLVAAAALGIALGASSAASAGTWTGYAYPTKLQCLVAAANRATDGNSYACGYEDNAKMWLLWQL